MKTLIAIDTIKNFEESIQIGKIFKENLKEDVYSIPLIDGGEGTIEAMKELVGGEFKYVNVHNPLNYAQTARYLMKNDLAIIEMAESTGLNLLEKDQLDVMNASSLGLGDIIKDCLDNNAKRFFIGLGDTASNDLGMGMLYALGARFYDENDNSLSPLAKNLVEIRRIDAENLDPRFLNADIRVGSNSSLTLFGENSFLETRIYQKGADEYDIAKLYNGSRNFTKLSEQLLGVPGVDLPSMGSGGGVAYSLFTYFKARILRPMEYIIEGESFKNLVKSADFLILGEDVSQFQAEFSKNLAEISKSYNENIHIIFLNDKNGEILKQKAMIDQIYTYDFNENMDRKSILEQIADLAKDVEKVCMDKFNK